MISFQAQCYEIQTGLDSWAIYIITALFSAAMEAFPDSQKYK